MYEPPPPAPEELPPGCAMPVVWALFSLVVVSLGMGLVAWQGYHSESAGVNAAMAAAFPVGFALTGGLAALVTHFVAKRSGAARLAVPPGCGCLGGIGMVLLTFLFFGVIFPAL